MQSLDSSNAITGNGATDALAGDSGGSIIMDRREFVIGAAAGLAVASASAASTATAGSHDHHAAGAHAKVDPKLEALRASTADCNAAAADCARHCIEMLATGDTSLASCLVSVQRMQAIVVATNAVAASESKPSARTRELAAVCADFCRDCAKECEPHAEKHAECKACLDACRSCIDACEALAA